jgi:hypothetical protein
LAADLIVVTLVPFLIALALLAVGLAPFVGAFTLGLLLVALGLWGLWKATANLLGVKGENVFRLAETCELLGRGGPDDPDFMLVPRRRHRAEDEAPTHDAAAARASSIDNDALNVCTSLRGT